jgi:hypothetical protein
VITDQSKTPYPIQLFLVAPKICCPSPFKILSMLALSITILKYLGNQLIRRRFFGSQQTPYFGPVARQHIMVGSSWCLLHGGQEAGEKRMKLASLNSL